MGLNLASEEIAALEARTEGWIAGLQLAAISLRGREDTTTFISSFAGSHHFVVDYLVEDVLEQQPIAAQHFLLQTAILSRLSAPLCDAVTGQDDGQATLETLERNNLFVVGLDSERQWYRYHHLFSDLLRRRLRQTHPEWIPALHRRACDWYRQNGYAAEAIAHALQVQDFELAADLLEAHIEALWGRGQNSKVQEWLDTLPEAVLFTRPSLTIFQARYQCNTGRVDAAERSLEAAVGALAGDSAGTAPAVQAITAVERMKLQGRAATTRALICSYQGDGAGIIRHADRALALLPADDLTWRSVNAILLGNAHGFRGDMPAAYTARFEALRVCQAAGDIYFIILANLELAITLREQGQLQRTVEICRQQREVAGEYGLAQSRTGGWLLAVWGETLAELDRLDEALERAQQGFSFTGRSENMQMFGWSFMCLARILLSRGELTGLEEAITAMERTGQAYQMPPWITDQVAAWQARLWLAQGQPEKAAGWVEARSLEQNATTVPPDEIGFFPLFDYIVYARILIAQERLEEAIYLLTRLLEAAEAGGRTSSVITIRILQALTFQAQKKPQEALTALAQALALAEPQGFVRVFVDEGAPMARLLHEVWNRGVAPEYVGRLLAAFRPGDTAHSAPQIDQSPLSDPRSPLIEPLSDREVEVLHLIADGLTNRQIAERLYLSLNTVKVHTRNIYGKLNVHSRTQAVARAQELGLLPRRSV
jgi:LuxR family maltose regulon positive regulatory protein